MVRNFGKILETDSCSMLDESIKKNLSSLASLGAEISRLQKPENGKRKSETSRQKAGLRTKYVDPLKIELCKKMAEEKMDWTLEATAVIEDVKNHVKTIEISEKLVTDGSCIFMNVKIYFFVIFFIKKWIFLLGDYI